MSTRTISTDRLLADLRAGMTHADVMAKYGLSASELDRVLGSLALAGVFAAGDTNRDQSAATKPVRNLWRCPACHTPQTKPYETCPQCGIIVERFIEKMSHKEGPAPSPELQDPGLAHEPNPTDGRLHVRLPRSLTKLWIALGMGLSLVVLLAMRPFPDLSWFSYVLTCLLLIGMLSVCSWFIVKGVYLFRVRNNEAQEDVLIVAAIVVATVMVIVTFVLAGIRGEAIRIKYRSAYAPLIKEIHTDLERLDAGISLEQHRAMVGTLAAQRTRIELRIKDDDPSLVRMVGAALNSLRQADEIWSKIAEIETGKEQSSASRSVDRSGKVGDLVQARQKYWDSFREQCLEILRYMDRKTR